MAASPGDLEKMVVNSLIKRVDELEDGLAKVREGVPNEIADALAISRELFDQRLDKHAVRLGYLEDASHEPRPIPNEDDIRGVVRDHLRERRERVLKAFVFGVGCVTLFVIAVLATAGLFELLSRLGS